MTRWLRFVLFAFVGAACSHTAMTVVNATAYAYDAPAVAHVDAQSFRPAQATPTPLGVALERSALPSVVARGASTTPCPPVVATEEGGETVRHYTTSEAAESIMKGGEITPGSSGKIWVTPDEYLDGVTAQQRLALDKTPDGYFEIPVCRVSCPSAPSPVDPWNGQPGGGIEITTNSPIDVTGLQFRTFGPR